MSTALVVGGSNGIGLAISRELLKRGYEKIIIADKEPPQVNSQEIEYLRINLTDCNFDVFKDYNYIDTLIITAGFGRVALFDTIIRKEIENSFRVNTISALCIIKSFYHKLNSDENFNCLVMGSIAGWVASPMFALYASTKAALCRFIESVNAELESSGCKNRILNISPGSLNGTRFNGGENDLSLLENFAQNAIDYMEKKQELFIPDYDTTYKKVIKNYHDNPHQFGVDSFNYKIKSKRINNTPQIKVGYLSGTFDLFHIGHLNLLKRAKEYCDYLVVGVHKDGSHKGKEVFVPYDERIEILKSIKYVDEVIASMPEDMDVYEIIKYDYLFVGSDYKGTERFKKYEEYFANKDVEIIYFPYTKGTSSTQLREKLSNS